MAMTEKRIILLLDFLFNGRYSIGNLVTFFSDKEYKSALFKALDSMECKNMPENVTAKINSVLSGGCTVFFSYSNCYPHEILIVNRGGNVILSEYKSFRRCLKRVKEVHVEIFSNANRTGSLQNFTINHSECKSIAESEYEYDDSSEEWNEMRMEVSLKTSGCIVAYIDSNCVHDGVTIKSSEEIIPGADLSSYPFVLPHGVGSFGLCNEYEEMTSEIKFFTENNPKEIIYLGFLRDECSLLPGNIELGTSNVWSSECVILFAGGLCRYYNYHVKVEPRHLTNLQMYDVFKNKMPSAYCRCTSENGREKAKIAFYGEEDHENYIGSFIAGNIVGCTELPFTSAIRSVKNLDTCLELYYESGCLKLGRTVNAGHTLASAFLRKSTFDEDATEDLPPFRSFKLCQTFPSELFKVTAKAFIIKVKTNFFREFMKQAGQLLRLGEDKVFINNGSDMNGNYVAKGSIAESVRVEKLQDVFGAMNAFTIEIIYQRGIEIPSLLQSKIFFALMSAYPRPTSSLANGTFTPTEKKREFNIAKSFQVPPCTTYTVGMSVRVANLSMEYDVFTQVNGTLPGGGRMSAEVLETRLPAGLEYVKKLDNFTVVAQGKGNIISKYGFEPVFAAVGVPIKDCQVKSR